MCLRETLCPICEPEDLQLGRRDFLRVAGVGAAAVAGASNMLYADDAAPKVKGAAKPAEGLIKELYTTLDEEQKQKLVFPWNHGADNGIPSRHGMYNSPFGGLRIGDNYTPAQQELVERILRAICADDEGYTKITRAGNFDNSKSLQGCGAAIFGEPGDDKKFAWLFTSHHLTVRCDGNSEPGAAFGGPMYYGHSAVGYSSGNVYYYQTQSVHSLFDALDEKQQEQALEPGNPGEREGSIRFRKDGHPGIAYADLSDDQRKLAEQVMRACLKPFRKEDTDEVMEIVKANGGMEKIHFGYYKDKSSTEDKVRWHFWRLEGPGFVWNFRPLPHVHCYVNIAKV